MVHAKQRMAAVIAIGVAGLLMSGCTTPSTGTGSGSGSTVTDTIRSTLSADPTTFDPARVTALDDYRAARLMFDTVVRRDDDNKLVGGLAKSWTQTASQVVLTIRDDATCGDGTVITPTIVGNSIARLADPATKSKMAGLIFGGPGVRVTSDDAAGTVSIDLAKPYSELLVGLTAPAAGIVCPAGLKDVEGLSKGTVDAAVSGPYTLAQAKPGVAYDFALREKYAAWPEYATPLKGKPANTLSFAVGVDPTTGANQLITGEMQLALVPTQDLGRFKGNDNFAISSVPLGDVFIVFNQSEGSPFTDEKLRRAVAQVVDQKAIQATLNPAADLLNSAGDPDLQCVNTDSSLLVPQDLEAAKKVLDGVTIKLVGTNGLGVNGSPNVYVQERLLEAGAVVEFDNIDNGAWVTRVLGTDVKAWDMTVFASINNVGTLVTDMSRVIGPALEDGGRNMSRSVNPDGEAAYAAALAADTPEAKCAAYQEAQESMLNRVDMVPLVTNPLNMVTGGNVELRSPGGREDFSTLRIIE